MMADQIVSNTGMLTSLTFSRDQEHESDKTALETLMMLYGNVVGADQLFEVLQEAEGTMKVPEFFSTHPLSEKRVQYIRAFGREISATSTEAQATPLPRDFPSWLTLLRDNEDQESE
jgi:predicted Zn-dependent protease